MRNEPRPKPIIRKRTPIKSETDLDKKKPEDLSFESFNKELKKEEYLKKIKEDFSKYFYYKYCIIYKIVINYFKTKNSKIIHYNENTKRIILKVEANNSSYNNYNNDKYQYELELDTSNMDVYFYSDPYRYSTSDAIIEFKRKVIPEYEKITVSNLIEIIGDSSIIKYNERLQELRDEIGVEYSRVKYRQLKQTYSNLEQSNNV